MKSFNPKGILIAAAAAAAVAGGAQAADISGAGATFLIQSIQNGPMPTRGRLGWGSTISRSGRGWHQADQGKTVTFGASDMPLKPQDVKEAAWCSSP